MTTLPRALAHRSLHVHPFADVASRLVQWLRSECDPAWPIIRSLAAAGLLVILAPPIDWTRATRRGTS